MDIKTELNEKYGMRSATQPWFEYDTIYSSVEELKDSIVKSKCFILSIWTDFGYTLIEIGDNNMWSSGLVATFSLTESEQKQLIDQTWAQYASYYKL